MVGFAAETEDVVENAIDKRARKGCDWMLANDVSESKKIFGGEDNELHLVQAASVENWVRMSKVAAARTIADRVAAFFKAA